MALHAPPMAAVVAGDLPPCLAADLNGDDGVEAADNLLEKYLQVEQDFCQTRDHQAMLAESACTPNLVWREMVCKWGYDVVDTMGEARSVVYVAMNILDRFCAVVSAQAATQQAAAPVPAVMNERRYECASMTALFLAARVAGSCNLQMTDLIHMSRGSVRLQDIISMGKEMLSVLTWGPRFITPVDFLQAMLSSLPTSVNPARRSTLLESASFLVEVSVCDIYLSRFPPSQIAFAALLNAAQAEGLLSGSETEHFCHNMQEGSSSSSSSSLEYSSRNTRTVRNRLDSVYNRIEDNPQQDNNSSSSPHYISDDEEEDDDDADGRSHHDVVVKVTPSNQAHPTVCNATTGATSQSSSSMTRSAIRSSKNQERPKKRARRRSYCQRN